MKIRDLETLRLSWRSIVRSHRLLAQGFYKLEGGKLRVARRGGQPDMPSPADQGGVAEATDATQV